MWQIRVKWNFSKYSANLRKYIVIPTNTHLLTLYSHIIFLLFCSTLNNQKRTLLQYFLTILQSSNMLTENKTVVSHCILLTYIPPFQIWNFNFFIYFRLPSELFVYLTTHGPRTLQIDRDTHNGIPILLNNKVCKLTTLFTNSYNKLWVIKFYKIFIFRELLKMYEKW